jgi:DNA modification methylase
MLKSVREGSLKKAKLAKTKGRRERLARERRMADLAGNARRNDLLPDLAVREYEIENLRAPSRRTRKNNPGQIERIARSIAEFGFSQPILIRDGQVLDGWLRVLAAKELGMRAVRAIDCTHLDETQARALALASNRIAERGEWDLDELKIEFEELIELGTDLEVTGFSIEEQDIILLDPLDAEQAGEDPLDEPPAHPVTQPGDIWQLGDHRIVCGDALDEQTYRALLQGEEVHAVLTDPPYNVKIKGNVSGLGKKVHEEFAMASGEMSADEFQTFLDRVIGLLATCLVAGGVLFAFMDWRSVQRVYAAGEAAGLKLINLVVWYKEVGAMGTLYRSAHELLPVFCKGERPRHNNVALGKHGRDRTNVWVAPGANRPGSSANELLGAHATPKPVELCVDAILDVTQPGDIVLDAFLGSGTTLIGAQKTGRFCRGIELEAKFVDVAIRRWARLTALPAILVETGETFEQASERRARSAQPAAVVAEPAGEGA